MELLPFDPRNPEAGHNRIQAEKETIKRLFASRYPKVRFQMIMACKNVYYVSDTQGSTYRFTKDPTAPDGWRSSITYDLPTLQYHGNIMNELRNPYGVFGPNDRNVEFSIRESQKFLSQL